VKKNRFKNLALVVILIFVIPLAWQAGFLHLLPISNNMSNFSSIHSSAYVGSYYDVQLLSDTGFNYPSGNWTEGITGDSNDVDALISDNQARLVVVGDNKSFSNISGTPQPADWTKTHNPYYIAYPDTSTINSGGCYVSHYWNEDPNQNPVVRWERNVSMTEDMSNYIISNVSLEIIVNATVSTNNGAAGDGIEGTGDIGYSYVQDYHTGDYVKFTVYISDLINNTKYVVAWNQTYEGLGTDGTSGIMSNTKLETVSQADFIRYLTSVLSTDNHNFKLILEVRIHCEDNYQTGEQDRFDSIYINSVNLNFTYEQKINQYTGVSWNQDAGKISEFSNNDDYYIQVTKANLKFDYKIDQTWPTASSPNSVIRILINDNPYIQTIKLSNANTTYQEVSADGLNVLNLIPGTGDVKFSLQVYMRDEFGLNRSITISIDNVSLLVSYDILTVEVIPEWVQTLSWIVMVLGIALAAVGAYFVAYETYLKYPKFVRLIRGLRKRVRKGRSLKNPVLVRSREKIVRNLIKEKTKVLRIEPGSPPSGATIKNKLGGGIK